MPQPQYELGRQKDGSYVIWELFNGMKKIHSVFDKDEWEEAKDMYDELTRPLSKEEILKMFRHFKTKKQID